MRTLRNEREIDGRVLAGEALGGDAGGQVKGHTAGIAPTQGAARAWVSLSAECERPAGKTGSRLSEAQDGPIRTRLLLARSSLQARPARSEIECGLLA